MSPPYKYSVDFLPSGDVRMSLEGAFTTETSLKLFQIIAADELQRSANKTNPKKRKGKMPG